MASATAAAAEWSCARCEVTVSFLPDAVDPKLPSSWSEEGGKLYCLSCRRDLAGEASVEAMADETPGAERVKVRADARLEFEIKRDAERQDSQIARSCKTSTARVRRARERLGLKPAAAD